MVAPPTSTHDRNGNSQAVWLGSRSGYSRPRHGQCHTDLCGARLGEGAFGDGSCRLAAPSTVRRIQAEPHATCDIAGRPWVQSVQFRSEQCGNTNHAPAPFPSLVLIKPGDTKAQPCNRGEPARASWT